MCKIILIRITVILLDVMLKYSNYKNHGMIPCILYRSSINKINVHIGKF